MFILLFQLRDYAFQFLSLFVVVGLALAEQMIPSPYRLPTESWDWRVDGIMVGNGIMHVGKDMALSSGGRPE